MNVFIMIGLPLLAMLCPTLIHREWNTEYWQLELKASAWSFLLHRDHLHQQEHWTVHVAPGPLVRSVVLHIATRLASDQAEEQPTAPTPARLLPPQKQVEERPRKRRSSAEQEH